MESESPRRNLNPDFLASPRSTGSSTEDQEAAHPGPSPAPLENALETPNRVSMLPQRLQKDLLTDLAVFQKFIQERMSIFFVLKRLRLN